MDFMQDTLLNRRRFRGLNVIDNYNKKILKIDPYLSIGNRRLIKILKRIILKMGKPQVIRVDNVPAFIYDIKHKGILINPTNHSSSSRKNNATGTLNASNAPTNRI